ncbi:DUF2726 domain-containing protein [Paracidovorax cattleyae]|nr:hypothetical protein [Paracidovorax cattleyae]MBF9266357.1 hypothetical protein [Paracidovorax cattleyae]
MHSVLGRKYHFIPNVPLADIFSIDIKAFLQSYKIKPHWTGGNLFKANRKAIRRSALAALRGQIGRKAVDVLVCNTAGNIIAGLEIDGPHHGKYPYQGYDFSKSMLFRCKGIPLLRVASRNLAQWTWNTADTAKFFQELRVARTCWPVFDQNPSIATMQMHAP